MLTSLINPSNAQSESSIIGKVIDKSNNKAMSGASVRIAGTKSGAISGKDGGFSISGIDETNITIITSYIGYKSDTLKYNLTNSGRNITIKLEPEAAKLDEVVVSQEAYGKSKAMIEMKRAANIKNVVSAEQIEQFPDLNAAEAMQRIPGITLQRDQGEGRYIQLRGTPPELTNFNINGEQIPSPEGNVRYVGMDIISSDQIEFIEVSKVLTPDMDADGIAGTVNIITKKASSEKPEIKASIAGGYGNLRSNPNYQLQLSYGQKYENFGFQVDGSYYRNDQGSDNMEFKYAKGPFWGSTDEGKDNYHVQYREVQLRHYEITRQRTGLSATLDYSFDENSYIYARAMLNNFSDDETRRRKIYDLDDAISLTSYLYGGIDHDVKDREKIQDVNTFNLGGKHEIFGFTMDYEAAYSVASENQPERIEARFDSPGQAIAIKFVLDDPDWPVATFSNPSNAPNATMYDKFTLDELLFESLNILDKNYTGKVNFKMPYSFDADSKGFIQFGAKYRHKDKTRDITSQNFGAYFTQTTLYPGVAPELSLASLNDGFRADDFLNRGYILEFMPSADMLRNWYEFYPQHFIIDRTASKVHSFGEDYSAQEDIAAGYAMFRHDLGDLMLLGGVRIENTEIDYQGMRIITERGRFAGLDTLNDKRSHNFVLPQFQIKYMLDNSFNLRAAFTYTYSRPNFEDVLPYREEDRDEVRYGNPDLKYPTSLNIDLLAEKYFTDGGLVSGGLFFKKIDDFVFYFKRFAHEGTDFSDYGLVEITKAINGDEIFVWGAEIQSQFKFDFLPSFFSDFGLYFTYTFTYADAYVNKRFPANYADAIVIFGADDLSVYASTTEQERISFPGQAKNTINLALFYDDGDLYAKISANYHDAFLSKLGADKDLDEYYDAALHVDFTAHYKISSNIKAFVDVINLTNAPLKYYLGTPDYIQKQEYYSWWGRVGFKLSF